MESMHQIVVQIAKVQLLKVPFAVKRLKVHHLKVQLKDWKPCKIMNNHKYKFTIALDQEFRLELLQLLPLL